MSVRDGISPRDGSTPQELDTAIRDSGAAANGGYSLREYRELPYRIIEANETLDCRFPVENNTPGLLEVARLSPSCGCSEATISSERIEAGGSAELTVLIKLSETTLAISRGFSCEVEYHGGITWQYGCKFEAYPAVEFSPHDLYFGALTKGERCTKHADIRAYAISEAGALARLPDTVTSSSSAASAVLAGLASVERSPRGPFVARRGLIVTLEAPENVGTDCRAELKFMSGASDVSRGVIPVVWSAPDRLIASPRRIVFGRPPHEVTREATILRAAMNETWPHAPESGPAVMNSRS